MLDFAGFGGSDEPSEVYSVAKYADDVLKLLAYLGIENGIFVGHSFGGRVCLELASGCPHIVRKLVLVDSAGIKPRRGIKYCVKVGLHKLLRKMGFKGLSGSSDFRALSPLMKETFKNVVKYYATMMEPWDGPASILFSDGDILGAQRRRNACIYGKKAKQRHYGFRNILVGWRAFFLCGRQCKIYCNTASVCRVSIYKSLYEFRSD